MKEKVEALCRQHDELRALTDTYEREVLKPAPDLAALAKCRWTLARLASGHLAYEQMHLYGVLAGRGDRAAFELANGLSALGELLDAHVRNWTPAAIAHDWAGYGESCMDLINSMRDQMQREEARLFPQLLVAKAA